MKKVKSKTKEYRCWDRILRKCHDPKHPRYKWYGARGIAVCQRWRDSFDDFLLDMGPAPTEGHTIEREDNDRGYEPGNCVWATMKEQGQNRRSNVKLEHAGETLTIAAWAERKGMDRRVLWKRLRAGWDLASAIDTPKAPRGEEVPAGTSGDMGMAA